MSYHKDLTGDELHVPGYMQDTDPGAVGAGKYWIDTSGGVGNYILKVRNSDNSGWEIVSASGIWKLIEKITVESDTTSITFSTNVEGYTTYKIFGSIINNSGSNCVYAIYLNNDTDPTHYYRQFFVADGSSRTSGTSNDSNFAFTISNSAQNHLTFEMTIQRAPTDNYWKIAVHDVEHDANGQYPKIDIRNINYYVGATSLTQIQITANQTNGIGTNSEFKLLGLNA